MNTSELMRVLETPHREELTLEIVVAEPSQGALPTVRVVSVGPGIDWDKGKLLFRPEFPLYRSNAVHADKIEQIRGAMQERTMRDRLQRIADILRYTYPEGAERLRCSRCGKTVSTAVPQGTVVRAWIECPECLEAQRSK